MDVIELASDEPSVIIEQRKAVEGVTEELKARNQLEWADE